MVKPGEVLIVPLSASEVTPTPILQPIIETKPMPNWKIWYELFFSDQN